MRDHKSISVILGIGDEHRRAELHAALDAAVTVIGVEASIGRAMATVADLIPDVVVLDESSGRAATAEACWHTLTCTPATRSVVLTAADDEMAYEALLHGAFSVLRADAIPSLVTDAVIGAMAACVA